MIEEYKVISSALIRVINSVDFSAYINGMIKDGWQPLGGVTVCDDILFQTMVKRVQVESHI